MNKGHKKADHYFVETLKGSSYTHQVCNTRQEMNRIIVEARQSGCQKIVMTINFNNQ